MRAATYRRISSDDEGLELGVQRQADDLARLALERGYEVVADYVDNDAGASTRSKKVRHDYLRMLEDARAGRFEVILAYSSSRLTRRPRELEDLIDLAQTKGIRYEYIRSPSFNLNTADGQTVARLLGGIDAGEAIRTAERVSRKRLQNAQSGILGGGHRAFGWKPGNLLLEPVEAALIRDGAAAVLKGGYLASVVSAWIDSGVPSARGAEWKRTSVKGILTSPRVAGLSFYKGEVLYKDEEPVRGLWEPILDVETWLAVCAALNDKPKVQPYRSFLLSGIIRCHCGTPMAGNGRGTTRDGYYYRCHPSNGGCGSTITGPSVDDLVEKLVLRKLKDKTARVVVAEFDGDAELALLKEQVDEMMSSYNAGILPGSVAFPQIAEKDERRKTLRRQKAAHSKSQELPPSRAVAMWESGDLSQRREVVKRLLAAVVIHPSLAGLRSGPRFDRDRVVPVERE